MTNAATILEREPTSSALDAAIVAARANGSSLPALAKRFGVTCRAVRDALERAEDQKRADRELAGIARRIVWAALPPARDDADRVDAAEEKGWLTLRRSGWDAAMIADDSGAPVHVVLKALAAAQAREVERGYRPSGDLRRVNVGKAVLLFPAVGFSPTSPCPHRGPIPKGSLQICAVCHKGGFDHWRSMRPDARDPRPDPKPKAKPLVSFTRQERRNLAKAAKEAKRAKKVMARLDGRRA